jgi:hypothetical protein
MDGRLSDKQVAHTIKAFAVDLGLDASTFGGHLSMLGASPSAQLAASAFRSQALKDRQKSISASSALPSPASDSFPDISAGRDIGFSAMFSHLSFDPLGSAGN